MAGINLWRCSRCSDHVAVVVDHTKRFCGDCFYRVTVERIMSAAFASDDHHVAPAASESRSSDSTSMVMHT